MAKQTDKTDKQFAQIEETLTKTEQYIEDNQKSLTVIAGAIVAIVAIYLGFTNFYLEPLEQEAHADMYMAEIYFEKDSFNLALNGDGQYLGFLDIADEYSLTNAGNLANYYAGLCYLHTAQSEDAIEYLSDFSSDDIILSTLALGCIGDAYLELEDNSSALKYYEKAADNASNDFTTPRYLMKQAIVLEMDEEFEDALKIYNQIKQDYSKSQIAQDIEKYIVRASNR
ncbi:MAG: tetratricopeptide repeat protein [Flavobacteriales bacterium]|jgi:tetratricopeptide (TPR) repeat protein|nr:tetratricopeptide repeat protein [Flavobacteriales bacterium]HJN63530.1 tetratricopeptide repeat protein [Flavobacteriales bacterium]|tara:strand:- start:715 stop:1395 length:681 start_codon:yes stop_codon:yes gene_type:complete